jgi:hypothetical protein
MVRRFWEEYVVPDRILALSAVGISFVLIALSVFKASPVALLLALLFGIPGAVWLLSKGKIPLGTGVPLSDDALFVVSGSYFLVLAGIVTLFALRELPYARPIQFFLLVPLLVGLTVIAALGACRPAHHVLCLVQTALIGVLLCVSQVLLFPDVVGIDPWFHKALTTTIAQTGFLPLDTNFAAYLHFPILHLTVAAMSMMTGLPYHLSAFLSGAVPIILIDCIFVYLVARELLPGRQAVALLAPLLVVVNPSHINMTLVMIPNGFAVIFLFPALYLLYRSSGRLSRPTVALLVLLLGTLILTHTVSALFMAIILFVLWAAFRAHARFIEPAPCFPLLVPLVFTVALLAWWTFDSNSIAAFLDLISKRFTIDYFKPDELASIPRPATVLSWDVFVNHVANYLFLFLPLLGMLCMLSRRGTRLTFTHALLGLIPLAIVSLSYVMPVTTLEDRWLYFAAVMNGAAMAVTLFLLQAGFARASGGRNRLSLAILLVLLCAISTVAIINPIASVDFSPTGTNDGTAPLIRSEIAALSASRDVWARPQSLDHYYYNTQEWTDPAAQDFTLSLYEKNFTSENRDLVMVRERIQSPEYIYSYTRIPAYDLDETLLSSGFSQVYDGGTVRGYGETTGASS